MNNQSWKFTDGIFDFIPETATLNESSFLQIMIKNCNLLQKQKSLNVQNVLKTIGGIQYVIAIAKIISVFNMKLDKMDCLQKLKKREMLSIRDFQDKKSSEIALADLKRRQFFNQFKKSTDPPLRLAATFRGASGVILIIQKLEDQQKHYQIKILNYENLIHSILSLTKLDGQFQGLKKFLYDQYKNTKTVVCYTIAEKKIVDKKLIQLLLSKFQQVFYIGISITGQIDPTQSESKLTKVENINICVSSNEKIVMLHTHRINSEEKSELVKFYNKFLRIDKFIMNQIKNCKQVRNAFKNNQLFISLYGHYYNFISLSGVQNYSSYQAVQNLFLDEFVKHKILQEEKELQEEYNPNEDQRQHSLINIDNKGTKVCCVCKKKKVRTKCQGCSKYFARDIALCRDDFKTFHENKQKYIPKGVKAGVRKNQTKLFKKLKLKTQESNSMLEQENVEAVISQWDQRRSRASIYSGIYVVQHLANLRRSLPTHFNEVIMESIVLAEPKKEEQLEEQQELKQKYRQDQEGQEQIEQES